jgi:uncharacterized protein involved in exopolysaccharide biosynthesis
MSNVTRACDAWEAGRTLEEYWYAVYRRGWLILLVIATAAGVSWWLSAKLQPTYEVKTVFYVPLDVVGSTPGPEQGKARLPTGMKEAARAYVMVLRGADTVRRMSERFPAKPRDRFFTDVDFVVTKEGIIRVYVRDRDPQLAAEIARAYYEYFNEFNEKLMQGQVARSLDNLAVQQTEAQRRRTALEDERRTYQHEHQVASIGDRVRELEENLVSLEDARRRAAVELKSTEQELEGVSEQLRREGESYAAGEIDVQDSVVESIRKNLVDLEIQLARVSAELKPDHPDRVVVQTAYDKAREALGVELQRIVASKSKLRGTLYEDYRARLAGLYVQKMAQEARTAALQTVIDETRGQIRDLPDVMTDLARIDRRLDEVQDQINYYRHQRDAILTSSAQLKETAVLIERAETPTQPVFPLVPLNVGVAALGGLIAGVLYVLLLDYVEARRHIRKLQRLRWEEWAEALVADWNGKLVAEAQS